MVVNKMSQNKKLDANPTYFFNPLTVSNAISFSFIISSISLTKYMFLAPVYGVSSPILYFLLVSVFFTNNLSSNIPPNRVPS